MAKILSKPAWGGYLPYAFGQHRTLAAKIIELEQKTLLRDFYHPSTMELLEDVHGNFVAHELLLLTIAGDNRREEIARQVRILPGLSPGTQVPSFRRTRQITGDSEYVEARIRAYVDMVAAS